MLKTPLVSIIIPVYEVEKYLDKCLLSIINQDLESYNYEIIIINDGSIDNSGAIGKKYSEEYKNIFYLEQENQGVSVARNQGLEIAKGKYILFIDPDDTIYENSLKKILARAEQEYLEILYLHIESVDEKGNILEVFEMDGEDHEVKAGFIHPRRTFLSTLYKSEIIGKIRFVKGILRGQDTVFNAMVQSNAKRCSSCSIPYYKYLSRNTSSRQYLHLDRTFYSNLKAIDSLIDFQKKYFPNPIIQQEKYFTDVIEIFGQRTLEWIIIPRLNRRFFKQLKLKLKEHNSIHIINNLANTFPFFNQPFFIFYSYHRLEKCYYGLLSFLSTLKRKIWIK